jgi:hypothetical protein
MKSIAAITIALLCPFALASNQSLSCYGINQEANLQLEFGGSNRTVPSVTINDEGQIYEANLPRKRTNRAAGTVTYSQARGPIKVTIPLSWLDRGFDRFSKHDRQRGFEISELTKFVFNRVNGIDRSIVISECQSDSD